MTFRTWLIDKLGGDRPVGDPNDFSEVALVELWQSQLIVTALREQGIDANVLPEHSLQWTGERVRPQARILVPNSQRMAAIEIIDKTVSGRYGPTDDE